MLDVLIQESRIGNRGAYLMVCCQVKLNKSSASGKVRGRLICENELDCMRQRLRGIIVDNTWILGLATTAFLA